jgi:hypothetical protein
MGSLKLGFNVLTSDVTENLDDYKNFITKAYCVVNGSLKVYDSSLAVNFALTEISPKTPFIVVCNNEVGLSSNMSVGAVTPNSVLFNNGHPDMGFGMTPSSITFDNVSRDFLKLNYNYTKFSDIYNLLDLETLNSVSFDLATFTTLDNPDNQFSPFIKKWNGTFFTFKIPSLIPDKYDEIEFDLSVMGIYAKCHDINKQIAFYIDVDSNTLVVTSF